MCGIVGALVSSGSVTPGLIAGLSVLEYRGYDSAGIAVARGGEITVRKRRGRLANLEEAILDGSMEGALAGIGHTRWATHGEPSDANAHPHTGRSSGLALVHNGIVENYLDLKRELLNEGEAFTSETDTEVLARMLDRLWTQGGGDEAALVAAVRTAIPRVRGYYALAVLANCPTGPVLLAVRQGPPLVVGVTPEGGFLSSDMLGVAPHTRELVYLEDGDIALIGPGRLDITGSDGSVVTREARTVQWDPADSGKGGYPHYMLKEIHEQPDVIARTAFDRIDLGAGDVRFEGGGFDDAFCRSVERIQILGCGTALHAGQIAKYLIEGLAHIPVDVDFASEFRYRDPRIVPGTLALAITQSGETADTLAATRLARELGARVASICNVAGSSQVRESDATILTYAGPEIGVASTKAFTAQVAAATLLAIRLARGRGVMHEHKARQLLEEFRMIRPKIESLLTDEAIARTREIARKHAGARGFLFLGRGVNYPVALEGALKLKEIAYVHAEGYAAGEMKHGPIALIDPGMTILAINSVGHVAEKTRANIEQVKARGGVTVSVGSDDLSHSIADSAVPVPATDEWLSPILNSIPLQLIAYHIAEIHGCDIDKPRNLAKSVTVE
ncbi:Glutamine--fructose-6-phosphate aminotransferase [isomerizing] [Planctomycetes bacterium Poly30]|uniref:Glutamine--fructose-6-phosphate aminotransferase [isomerizing] n=1 Tax=Saltatorellus ferox TaxID=2528018 RepID=A0A518ERH4_9BACT|nr:Glutamine--fructose-6-phosphate aminotransferase [isomerizing] [Planctomycetes bacterium Poly30]